MARFSTHPALALPHLEPWAYGNVFYHRAKSMLGSMLSVPSRDAVLGFMLLAHMAFANGTYDVDVTDGRRRVRDMDVDGYGGSHGFRYGFASGELSCQ
jgi:hypothetical protein